MKRPPDNPPREARRRPRAAPPGRTVKLESGRSATAKPVAEAENPKPKISAAAGLEGRRTKVARRTRRHDPTTEVGFRKPPKIHSWKKGQSGNPKGRKKGSRNKKTIIISLMEGRLGRKIPDPRKLTAQEAMLWKAIQQGLAGDAKAMAFAFKRYDDATAKSWIGPVITTEEDRLVYDALRAKIRTEIEDERQ